MPNENNIHAIFDTIEPALQSAGYKILDGDDDTAIIKAPSGAEYEISVKSVED